MSVRTAASASSRVGRTSRAGADDPPRFAFTNLSIRSLRPSANHIQHMGFRAEKPKAMLTKRQPSLQSPFLPARDAQGSWVKTRQRIDHMKTPPRPLTDRYSRRTGAGQG